MDNNWKIDKQKVLSRKVSDFTRFLHEQRHVEGSDSVNHMRRLKWYLYEAFDSEGIEMTEEELASLMESFTAEMFGRMYEDADQADTIQKQWAEDIHSILNEQSEFQNIKRMAGRDADLSSLATAYTMNHFKDEIISVIKYREKEEQERKEEEEKQKQEQQDQQEGQSQGSQDGQPDGSPQEGGSEGQAGQDEEQQDSKPSELPDSIKHDFLKKAMELDSMQKQMEELKDSIQGIGSLGSNNALSAERTELVNQLRRNQSLRNLMKMVGRLKKMMHGRPALVKSKRKVRSYEIEQSRAPKELTRERMLAAQDETFDQYLFRFATRKQWKRKKNNGEDKLGLGPILMCIDNSGSMSGARIEMASALAVAMASIAKDTKRDFHAVTFNGRIDDEFSIPKKTKNAEALQTLMQLSRISAGGGTRFEDPLKWAATKSLMVPNADVLFLTDGSGRCSEDVLETLRYNKKKRGLRVFTILVGGSADGGSVQEMSDGIISVHHLKDGKSLNELATLMKTVKVRKV